MGRLRYTVFGAGAVGGVIAAHLAQRDAVSVVARGAHLEAIRRNGLRFRDLEGVWREANVAAASDADDLEPADIVLVTLKAQFVATLAGEIDAARKPGGLVVFIQNGLPWWVGPDAGLDAGQRLHDIFLNCAAGVVYFGATIPAPGAVAQTAPGKLLLGPALGQYDDRLAVLAGALIVGGLEAEVAGDIREAIWRKLQVNVALNGIAALTRAPILDILDSVALRPVLSGLADDIGAIARAMGHAVSFDIEGQRQIIRRGQKSSTLQDIEAGKPIEYDALFGRVLALARRLGVPVPALGMVAPMIGELSRQLAAPRGGD